MMWMGLFLTGTTSALNRAWIRPKNLARWLLIGIAFQISVLAQKTTGTPENMITAEVAIDPDENALMAHTSGMVAELDQRQTTYQKGAIIFRLVDLEQKRKILELTQQLRIEKIRLNDLQRLSAQGAASFRELNAAKESLAFIAQQLGQLKQEQRYKEVRAPCNLSIKNCFISNGMMLKAGMNAFDYLTFDRVKIRLELPLTQAYFRTIQQFKIDGQAVERIVRVDWRLNAQKSRSIVTFLVVPGAAITAAKPAQIKVRPQRTNSAHQNGSINHSQIETVASVRSIQERIIVAPSIGPIHVLVKEGELVKAGQLLALQEGSAPQEYTNAVHTLELVQAQLRAIRPTTQTHFVSRDAITRLQERESTLLASLIKLKTLSERLKIKAPESGIVTTITSLNSSSFREGNEVLRLRTSPVCIGDVNDATNAILLPKDIAIQIGDPVLVRTPSGATIPARIQQLNRMPISSEMELGAMQSVEIVAQDPNGILWKNLPVQVVLPAKEEKATIRAALKTIALNDRQKMQGTTEEQPEAWLPVNMEPTAEPSSPTNEKQLAQPQSPSSSSGIKITLSDVEYEVAGNDLLHGDLTIDVLKQREAERLAKGYSLDLDGRIFVNDGTLKYSGGISGTIQGVMAGVQSGNAIGASLPVVFGLSGKIMDLVSGKAGKMEDLAVKMTQIAQHHMEEMLSEQIHDTTGIFIDIATAKNHIHQLDSLLIELGKAEDVLTARARDGFSTSDDRDMLLQQIADVRAQHASWQQKENQWLRELNHLFGLPLEEALYPWLPWDGQFPGVSGEQERNLLDLLVDDQSRNYRLKGAKVALAAMEETIALQKLKLLPSVDLHSLYLTDGEDYNPLYNIISGSVMRTSILEEGQNGTLGFNLPIFNTKRNVQQTIATLERNKVRLNLQRVRTELHKSLTQAISDLRDLSSQIHAEENAYHTAYQSWRQKTIRPDLYRADQLVGDSLQMNAISQRLYTLKAHYFKAESRLRQLQLLGYGETRIQQRKTSSKASEDETTKPGVPALETKQKPPTGSSSEASQKPADKQNTISRSAGGLSAGSITYPPIHPTELWILMSGQKNSAADPLQAIARVLIEDPNALARMNTLDVLLEEFREGSQFFKTSEKIILNSPYPDVVQRLLLFLADQNRVDPSFFIHLIDQAIQQKNPELAERGFYLLNDLFLQNPAVLKELSEFNHVAVGQSNRTPLSRDTIRRVLATFLAWAPADSIARMRLLRSPYWTTDQLAQIWNALGSSTATDTQSVRLLIHDEILRRESLLSTDEIFNKGPFKKLPAVLFSKSDIYAAFMLGEFRIITRRFLEVSPEWRTIQDYVPARLYNRAKEATEALLLAERSLPKEAALRLDPIPNGVMNTDSLLAHFNRRNLEDQKTHILQTPSFPELSRILQSASPLKGAALDRLMENPSGRIQVLHVYLKTEDEALCALIEDRDWMNILRTDITLINDPVSNMILRQALKKMFDRTNEEWPLNIRLKTYGFAELHTAIDPRGEDVCIHQIHAASIKLALGLIDEWANNQLHFLAGHPSYNSEELALIDGIRQRVNRSNSPEEVCDYLEHLEAQNEYNTRPILREIIRWRDKISGAISRNDQRVPFISFRTQIFLWIVTIIASILGFMLLKRRVSLKVAKEHGLIMELRRVFSIESSEGKRHEQQKKETFAWLPGRNSGTPSVIAIPEYGLDQTACEFLQRWQNIVCSWKRSSPELSPRNAINDLNSILNHATYILLSTAYTPTLMGKGNSFGIVLNEQFQQTLSYTNMLAIDTLHMLNHALVIHTDFDGHEKKALLRDINRLVQMMKYTTTYLRILEYRGIIDKVMSYKFADRHWAERSKLYPFFRWCLLYQYQLTTSKKKLDEELPQLLKQGQYFMPNLYGSIEGHERILRRSKWILADAITSAKGLVSPLGVEAGYKHKMRSFISRLRHIYVPLSLAVLSIMSLLGISSLSAGTSLIGVAGILVGLFVFWIPHYNIMQVSWAKVMVRVIRKLDLNVHITLEDSSTEETSTVGHVEQKIARLAVQEGLAQLQNEMNPNHQSSVDMIVIIPEDDQYAEPVKNYVEKRKGTLFRKDIPVEVQLAKTKRSANAYFETMQFVQDKLANKAFLRAHPQLKGIPWLDVKIMIIFHGNNKNQDDRILDWSIINGYRVAQSTVQQETPSIRGGHIIIYSRDVYLGPISEPFSKDINLLGDWVSQKELNSLGLLVMDYLQDGINVREILQKLDISDLQRADRGKTYRNRMLHYLDTHYDLGKQSLRQFPALTGIMGFSPKTVAILGTVLDGLKNDPALWNRMKYLHMTIDVLNNLLKPQGEVLNDYFDARINFSDIHKHYGISDRDEARDLYHPFYKIFHDARDSESGLTVNSILPHSGAAKVIHIKLHSDMKKATELLQQSGLEAF